MNIVSSLALVKPVVLSQLRSGGYAIVLRASPADGGLNLFCDNIA